MNLNREKKAILVVSFGTSYRETRKKTIEALENEVAETFKDYDVKRAFTSKMIMRKLLKRDGMKVNNIKEALEELIEEGYSEVIIQPTHIMGGKEFHDVVIASNKYRSNFEKMKIGMPLLSSREDFEKIGEVIFGETGKHFTDDKTAVVFMGHGSYHGANSVYSELQLELQLSQNVNYFVGTVEGFPEFEHIDILARRNGVEKVVLLPFMIVVGDHANNDMAGDDEDSWKVRFREKGYEVEIVLKGLGEYKGVRDLYVDHIRDAIES